MGWRGTLRSLNAISRAYESDTERERKRALKVQISSDAAAALSDWEEHIDRITSQHQCLIEPLEWHSVAATPPPIQPQPSSTIENKAIAARNSHKPSKLDVLFGGTQRRIQRLDRNILRSRQRDKEGYDAAFTQFQKEFRKWNDENSFARRVLAGEIATIRSLLESSFKPTDSGLIAESISFSFASDFVHATPEVLTDEIVPDFRRKQLASGRLSETKMPKREFHQIYQDYVTSVAFKVAGDLLQILPFNEIYVTCVVEMLNSKTGHVEKTPVLSVQFVRNTFNTLYLDCIDPSDALNNFRHSMKFTTTRGFERTEALQAVSRDAS